MDRQNYQLQSLKSQNKRNIQKNVRRALHKFFDFFCTHCPSFCSIWPLKFLDVHQAEDAPHLMDLKGQRGINGISRSIIPCGLSSMCILSSSKTHKGMIELLSPVGIAVCRRMLIYAVVWCTGCPATHFPFRKMDPDLLPGSSLLHTNLQIVSVAVLSYSASPHLNATFRSLSSAWTTFVILDSMFGKTLVHFSMYADNCSRTSAHKTTHKDWGSTELLRLCKPPCWTEQRGYRPLWHQPKCQSCHNNHLNRNRDSHYSNWHFEDMTTLLPFKTFRSYLLYRE